MAYNLDTLQQTLNSLDEFDKELLVHLYSKKSMNTEEIDLFVEKISNTKKTKKLEQYIDDIVNRYNSLPLKEKILLDQDKKELEKEIDQYIEILNFFKQKYIKQEPHNKMLSDLKLDLLINPKNYDYENGQLVKGGKNLVAEQFKEIEDKFNINLNKEFLEKEEFEKRVINLDKLVKHINIYYAEATRLFLNNYKGKINKEKLLEKYKPRIISFIRERLDFLAEQELITKTEKKYSYVEKYEIVILS